jgi:hypothetical protein
MAALRVALQQRRVLSVVRLSDMPQFFAIGTTVHR